MYFFKGDFATVKLNENTARLNSDLDSEDNHTPKPAKAHKLKGRKSTKKLDFSDSGEEGDNSGLEEDNISKNDKFTLSSFVPSIHGKLFY